MHTVRIKNIAWISLLILVITLLACWHYYHRITRFWGITQTDFNVYYYAGWNIVQNRSMYTSMDPEYLFKYAPIFGVVMIPLADIPIQIAIRWWYGFICFSFLGIVWLLRSILKEKLGRSDLPIAAYALILAGTLRPYLSNLRLGQIDIILAFLLLLAIVALVRGKNWLAGIPMGVVVLCKVVPGIWMLWMATQKRWRAVFWTAVSILTCLLLPIVRLGFSGNLAALHEWKNMLLTSSGNVEWLIRYKNQSVLSWVLRTLAGTDAAVVTPSMLMVGLGVTALLGVGFLVWIFKTMHGAEKSRNPLAVLAAPAMLMITMVIFSPHSWKATYIHLALPYALVAAQLTVISKKDRWMWGGTIASLILTSATAPDIFLGRSASHAAHLFSPMTWGALILAWTVSQIPKD